VDDDQIRLVPYIQAAGLRRQGRILHRKPYRLSTLNHNLYTQQGAYETAARLEKFGHSDPTISALIDEIMNFKEDPKYANYSPENYAYVQDISIRFLKATQVYNQKQPEQHIERVRDKVAKLYGHQSLDDGMSRLVL
jgi:hypothetical protein